MASVPEIQVFDVQDFTVGSDAHLGIDGFGYTVRRGLLMVVRKEASEVGTSFERAGTDQGPVDFTIISRSEAAIAALSAASGTVVFKGRNAGAGALKIFTLTGAQFETFAGQGNRDQFAKFTLSGKAISIAHSNPA